jgi:hypothetical protein
MSFQYGVRATRIFEKSYISYTNVEMMGISGLHHRDSGDRDVVRSAREHFCSLIKVFGRW